MLKWFELSDRREKESLPCILGNTHSDSKIHVIVFIKIFHQYQTRIALKIVPLFCIIILRYPVEEIRRSAVTMNKENWKIEFKWVKAHAGIHGNEIADRLGKEATQNYYVIYDRITKCAIKKDTRKDGIRKCQINGRKQRMERLLKNFFQV
jgi:hypothetical protein